MKTNPAPPEGGAPSSLNERVAGTFLGRGGEYIVGGELARGGMATVHLGSIRGAIGFVRAVAIKRLHAQYAKNENFVSMLVDEGRLASRIRHANVVPILDIVSQNDEIYLIMDFVHGAPLHRLITENKHSARVPAPIAASIIAGALAGLHAAHEARDEKGQPLCIVHRDISPQNIMVGLDGVARVLDFGVAKARGRLSYTADGVVKGKLGYMSPEQLRGKPLDRRTDIYAAGVVLWEALVGDRLIDEGEDGRAVLKALETVIAPPSERCGCSKALDAVVMRALEPDPARRYQTAHDMAADLEGHVPLAALSEVGAWVSVAGKMWIDRQADMLEVLDARVVQEAAQSEACSQPALAVIDNQLHTAITAAAKPTPAPRVRALLGVAAALAILLVGASLILARPQTRLRPPTTQLSPAPAGARVTKMAAVSTNEAPPAAQPPPPTFAADAAANINPVAKVASRARQSPARAGKAVRSAERHRIKAMCNPPYSVSEKGIRRYKPECF